MASTARDRRAAYAAADDAWRFRLWNYAYRMSGGEWLPYFALRYIADIVQAAVARGGGRVIITIPPRHGKSSLISHWLPTWFLDWYPHRRVIMYSYGDRLASRWGAKVRDEFRDNPETWTSIGGKDTEADWSTMHGGGMISAGITGPVVGFGADLFIVDDPYKNKEQAFNATYREKVQDIFKSSAYTRLEPGATVVVIMQRWHERDLVGWLVNEHSDDWVLVNLPAVAEPEAPGSTVSTCPLGRAVGDALIPERYNEAQLNQIMHAVGSWVWAALYQQRPAPLEGNLVKRDWWQYWTALPERIKRVVVSWDMSFKLHGRSMCVGQAWFQRGSRHWLLEQERFKADFVSALQRVVKFHNHCTETYGHVRQTLIEEAANGIPIISTVKGRMPRVKGITVSKSKLVRLSDAAPSVECGDVVIPDRTVRPWSPAFVDEVVSFPNAENDDQVDAFTQYVNRYKTKKVGQLNIPMGTGTGEPEWRSALS
jgi:predicted phage terminase large subunit-like protein